MVKGLTAGWRTAFNYFLRPVFFARKEKRKVGKKKRDSSLGMDPGSGP